MACQTLVNRTSFILGLSRAPDNFLKQGVADASLEAKGVFLQNLEVFSLPNFYTRAFLEVANLVVGKRKNAAHNQSHKLQTLC